MTISGPAAPGEVTRRPAPLRAPGNCSDLGRFRCRGDYGVDDSARSYVGALMRRWCSDLRGSQRWKSPRQGGCQSLGAVSGCAELPHTPHRASRRVPSLRAESRTFSPKKEALVRPAGPSWSSAPVSRNSNGPKCASASNALCARQRSCRFAMVVFPPSANGTIWWNSSKLRSLHRPPVPMKAHRRKGFPSLGSAGSSDRPHGGQWCGLPDSGQISSLRSRATAPLGERRIT